MLIDIITAKESQLRDSSLDSACRALSLEALLQECVALETFRRHSENLYERVRALFFLYAIHRFHLPLKFRATQKGSQSLIPFQGYEHLLQRRFEEAIDNFLAVQHRAGPSDAISSAL